VLKPTAAGYQRNDDCTRQNGNKRNLNKRPVDHFRLSRPLRWLLAEMIGSQPAAWLRASDIQRKRPYTKSQ
jgi:hypothetical protein